MTLSLKQITTVSLSSNPFTDYTSPNSPLDSYIFNPSTGIFVFNYRNSSPGANVGIVNSSSGTNLESFFSSPSGGINGLTHPGLDFSPLGQPYVVYGGGLCGTSACPNNNGSAACGPWYVIYNKSNGIIGSPTCKAFQSNEYYGHLQQIVADLVDGYVIIMFANAQLTPETGNLFVAFPFSQISTFASGTFPTTGTWALINFPSTASGATSYIASMIMYDGSLYIPIEGNASYLWVLPVSNIINNGNSGVYPPSGSSPITAGTIYTATSSSGYSASTLATISYSGGTFYITLIYISSTTIVPILFNPSNTTFTSLPTTSFTGSLVSVTSYNNVILVSSFSGSTTYLYVINPTTGANESTSVAGTVGWVSPNGYFVVATSSMTATPLNFTIYQILFDQTPTFQNVTVTVSGTTVTATGTLIDATSGNAIAGATVYLIAVRSYNDNFTDDVQIIGSTTTTSTGSFTVSGNTVSGINFYGVKYAP